MSDHRILTDGGWGWEDEVEEVEADEEPDDAADTPSDDSPTQDTESDTEGESASDTQPSQPANEAAEAEDESEDEPVDEPADEEPDETGEDESDDSSEDPPEPPEAEAESELDVDEGVMDKAEAAADSAEPETTEVPTQAETHPDSNGLKTAGDGADIEDLDTSHIASDALTTDQAASQGHRWKILAWGPPGLWKTHFGWTMPEPVVFIDTEGKAHDIAHKFEDRVTRLFQPTDYDEARDSLLKAIDILEYFQEETGAVGTIVVDSMSIMWEWAQQKYVDEWYPDDKSVADVEFKSAMQSGGAGDWKQIKQYHNEKFREVMLESDFHVYWTATETEDYEAVFNEEVSHTPMKPAGEKNNIYKVDHIIRARRNELGLPVGDLQKSGLVRHGYRGLRYPTFPKHEEIIGDISGAETSTDDVPIDEITEFDVTVAEGVVEDG